MNLVTQANFDWQSLAKIISDLASFLWGWPLIIVLLGLHVFMTLRLGFIQWRIGDMLRLTFSRDRGAEGEISHWGALATALAATVGTGNILGVAAAIYFGGPGAVFWMWMTGILGMATKYAEAVLSVKFRQKNSQGEYVGGPMYVLEHGLKSKPLAIAFATFAAIAAFGIGNMSQSSAITDNLSSNYSLKPEWVAIGLMVLTGAVILGGVRWIARACQTLVPVMVFVYLGMCITALLIMHDRVIDALLTIIWDAFSPVAGGGALVGIGVREAIRYGVARGLFSNESGMGSAPIVAAAARTSHPVRQGLVSASGTFWDTVVICLLTGLVIVSSGMWMPQGEEGVRLARSPLTSAAFSVLGFWAPHLIALALFTFVFSTILGWAYIGERAAEYLVGSRFNVVYRVIWIIAVGVGSVIPLDVVFEFSDILNALMVLPNSVALVLLSGVVLQETKSYFSKN